MSPVKRCVSTACRMAWQVRGGERELVMFG
jgi:hypothetical protein